MNIYFKNAQRIEAAAEITVIVMSMETGLDHLLRVMPRGSPQYLELIGYHLYRSRSQRVQALVFEQVQNPIRQLTCK